jgi:hypothetical protein
MPLIKEWKSFVQKANATWAITLKEETDIASMPVLLGLSHPPKQLFVMTANSKWRPPSLGGL